MCSSPLAAPTEGSPRQATSRRTASSARAWRASVMTRICASRAGHRLVEAGGLAARRRQGQEPHPRAGEAGSDRFRPILGAVRHHQDLELLPGVVERDEVAELVLQVGLLVADHEQDRDRGLDLGPPDGRSRPDGGEQGDEGGVDEPGVQDDAPLPARTRAPRLRPSSLARHGRAAAGGGRRRPVCRGAAVPRGSPGSAAAGCRTKSGRRSTVAWKPARPCPRRCAKRGRMPVPAGPRTGPGREPSTSAYPAARAVRRARSPPLPPGRERASTFRSRRSSISRFDSAICRSSSDGARSSKSAWSRPCEPIVNSPSASSRSWSQEAQPSTPTRAGFTKKAAGKPSDRRSGTATVASLSQPSSKVRATAPSS